MEQNVNVANGQNMDEGAAGSMDPDNMGSTERDNDAFEDDSVVYREHVPKTLDRLVPQDQQVKFNTPVNTSNRNSQEIPRHRHQSATVQPTLENKMQRNNSSHSLNNQPVYSKPKSQRDKNRNMVLHLQLTPGIQNGNPFNSWNPTPLPNGNTIARKRNGSNIGTHSDSLPSTGNVDFTNRSSAPNGFDYPNYGGGSVRGAETVISEAIANAKPSSQEEKDYVFRETITIILSIVYAIFVLTLGATIYVVDVIVDIYPAAEVFSYYIVCVSFIFIVYIIVDVKVYMNQKKAYNELMENTNPNGVEVQSHPDGGLQLSVPISAVAHMKEPPPHHYCLTTGRHGGSIYLKIGAAVFCLGHLVHCGLILGYQLVYLTSDEEAFLECSSIETLILDFIYPVYSFMLLYFIFKYSNVIINKRVPLARFGFMHCIASSLCFWIYTILRETFDALAFYNTDDDYTNATKSDGIGVRMFSGICDGEEGMAIIYQNFSPYLYPFSVEFSILVVGILYVVWDSIASCKESSEHDRSADVGRDCDSTMGYREKEVESNLTIHVDCHSSNKGTFAGILFFIVCVVSIILFFVGISDERFHDIGLTINSATELAILTVMGITAVWGYLEIMKLDINKNHISLLDDVLLFIAVPAFFLNLIFSIVPAVYFSNALLSILFIVQVAQVLLQTPFIIDGIRRCSNSVELRQQKPGREVIMFLIIANVSMWVLQTFSVKGHDLFDERYEFYGRFLWTILGHVSLPLMMFYRFHASVCLVDIWQYGYAKASH